ncbi:MAG: Tim44 domain-containing protein, partial [Spirochaetes bacterium]|nr:Tim44 domain-containing protein [Spirochaetota bacterium]
MKLNKKRLLLVLSGIIILLMASYLSARAGGAGSSGGGSSSSSGGGDGGFIIYLVFQLFRFIIVTLPFPINFITIGVIVLLAVLFLKQGKDKVQEKSVYNNIPYGEYKQKKIKGYNSFISNNSGFNEDSFKESVRKSFMLIQDAWMKQDLKDVRKFLSDGVYQRFNTQFKMMQILKQKNILSSIKIHDVFLDRVDTDGMYDIIHVGIMASMNDQFSSQLDSRLNAGGYNEFVEYWSFLRKRGVEKKDMFDVPKCPNCNGMLNEGIGEICKCPYCDSLLNSGEYDWVLSEITQADDYVGQNPKVMTNSSLRAQVDRLISENNDFSVQLVEDKASNGYLQILTAKTLNDPKIMRRFVSDEYFIKVNAEIGNDRISYNRLFLNDVSLIGIKEDGGYNKLFISVKASYQRVMTDGNKINIIDPFVVSDTNIVVMKRSKKAGETKGSLYSHNCPSCGGKLDDTLDINCQYCGSVLNNNRIEWIIDDICSITEYSSYLSESKSEFDYSINPKLLDSMYDVRDFAFNNVLAMIAADKIFDESEKVFVDKIAKKWGYNPKKIQGLYKLAFSGQLQIKMPADIKQKEKI